MSKFLMGNGLNLSRSLAGPGIGFGVYIRLEWRSLMGKVRQGKITIGDAELAMGHSMDLTPLSGTYTIRFSRCHWFLPTTMN